MSIDMQNFALYYEELMKYKFVFLVARRGKELLIEFDFKKEEFKHLLGIDDLKDIKNSTRNSIDVYEKILGNDQVLIETIKNSNFFKNENIQNRMSSFLLMKELLLEDNLVFKFNKIEGTNTKIPFEFILESKANKRFIFLKYDKRESRFFPISQFPLEKKDITVGHSEYIVLYKKIIEKSTLEEKVLFRHRNLSHEKLKEFNLI